MTSYYADTSVLLKRHVNEPGYQWFRVIVDTSDIGILTTELSIVEFYSAFNRLVREGNLAQDLYQDLTIAHKDLFEFRYESVPISIEIRNLACTMLERHPLRAYDAIHLASAPLANQGLVTDGNVGLIFLSADRRLLTAATAEGLAIFDPTTTL